MKLDPYARLYEIVVRLYPADFREEFGAEVRETMACAEADLKELPPLARQARRMRELGALLRTALQMRFGRPRPGDRSGKPSHGVLPQRSPHVLPPKRGATMENTLDDVRQALKGIARNPGFSLVVVLTLAAGIGANTAIFTVVDAVLLQPLPYEDPDRLVVIWRDLANRDVTHYPAAEADVVDYRAARSLEAVEALSMWARPLVDGDSDPESVRVGFATVDFLSVLGVEPFLGRGFEPLDAASSGRSEGGERAQTNVILSHALWQRRYAADPAVLGRVVRIDGKASTIIGVMPRGFRYFAGPAADLFPDVDVWFPKRIAASEPERSSWDLHTIARLAPGATVTAAQAELDAIAERQRGELPVYEAAGTRLRVEPMYEEATRAARPVIVALFGAVGFVLLIACVNVANLTLIRATGRIREISVRAALGADRARLLRQLLTESVLLALGAGLGGFVLAGAGIRWLVGTAPWQLQRLDAVQVDANALVFTLGVSTLAALMFGALPALRVSRPRLARVFQARSEIGGGRTQRRLRGAMVVAEVSLSMVLMAGAGLMARSLAAIQAVDPGFDAESVLSFQTTTPFSDYPSVWERSAFKEELGAALRALPGVLSVGSVDSLPLVGTTGVTAYGTEEMVARGEEADFQQAHTRRAGTGYFETMGARLLAGRLFTTADARAAQRRFVAARRGASEGLLSRDNPGIAIVGELFAARAWPGEEASGKLVYVQIPNRPSWFEVVGVVEHERQRDLSGYSRQNIYFPDNLLGSSANTMWVVRTSVDPDSLVGAIRAQLNEADEELPMARVQTMDGIVHDAEAPTRFAARLIGGFALAALLLALLGVYSVLAYTVRRRDSEIGVRLAFGAGEGRIVGLVMGQGLLLVGGGIVIGVGGALLLTRYMESMLVGVTPTDPTTFGATAALLLLTALLACYLPARRATRVDPMVSLRRD